MPKGKEGKSAVRSLGVSTAKGTLVYLAGNIIGSLAILLLLVILARLLSPAAFGFYAIAIAFFTILTSLYAFGVILRQEIPSMQGDISKARKLICDSYLVALLTALAVSAAAAALAAPIATYIYHDASLTGTLALAGGTVFLYTLFNLLLATLIAVGRVKRATLLYLLYSFLQLAFSSALVVLGFGVFGAVAGLGISLVVPSLLGIYWVARHLGRFARPTRKGMRHVVDFSVPVLVSRIATQAPMNLAVLLLGAFATSVVVGNYNAAFKFGNFVTVILTSTSYVIMPAFAKAFSDKSLSKNIGKIYNSSIYYTLLLLLPILVFAVSSAQPLFRLLFSEAYAGAPLYFVLIAIGGTLGLLNAYAGNLQVSYGDTRKFMNYQLAAVAVQVVLLFALTPFFGAIGTILGLFIISQVAIDFIYIYALNKQFSIKHSFGRVARLALASALLIAPLYGIALLLNNSRWILITNLAATILLFPPVAALFGAIKEKNLRFIREIAESLNLSRLINPLVNYTRFFVRG